MGYIVNKDTFNKALEKLKDTYILYAPKLYEKGANVSGLDLVRYGIINRADEIVFDQKSTNSYKEALHTPSQTLFYFTENEVKEAKADTKKKLLFLRSCDIHGLKRLDDVMRGNGGADYFYERIRKNVDLALIPCKNAFENCFCVDMQTNQTDDYVISIEADGVHFNVVCKTDGMRDLFSSCGAKEGTVPVPYVRETKTQVRVSPDLAGADAPALAALKFWEEYDGRCINCGRCTFGCPSCSCWTMQDMFYTENGRAGERRRVWASCMVDGYSDVAGGGSYRRKNGERMRFKVLHKIYDHQKRFGQPMCTGCGRCDDVCPEYISFSNCVNKLSAALESSNKGGV
jgi:anaerobic sulfite reductase subunit A